MGDCFWFESTSFRVFHGTIGALCLGTLLLCILKTVLRVAGVRVPLAFFLPKAQRRNVVPDSVQCASLYGPLLESVHRTNDQREVDEMDRDVDTWMVRGALAAVMWAVFMFALAMSQGLHYTGIVEACFSFFLAGSKLVVAYCAKKVHSCLSPVASAVAGPWILVLAISKLLMAGCALVQSSAYVWATIIFGIDSHDVTPENESFCWVLLFFVLNSIVYVVLQSVAAFALFCLQEKVVGYIEDLPMMMAVGCCWSLLTVCTFCVGVAFWIMAFFFVFKGWSPAADIMGPIFFLASVFQAGAGVSLLLANRSVKRYFASTQKAEAAPPACVGLDNDKAVLVICPRCGAKTLVSKHIGQVRCRSCSTLLNVPGSDEGESELRCLPQA